MSAKGTLITVLATRLADAVRKDEEPEEDGFDLSAGMFGVNVSNWIRSIADELAPSGFDLDLIKAAARGDFLINALCDPDFGDLEAIAKALPDESSVPGVAEFTAALDAVIAAKTQTKEPL